MPETNPELQYPLYLVVPCYNEEEVVEKTASVMGEKLSRLEREEKIAKGSKVMFVNDGSKDKTLHSPPLPPRYSMALPDIKLESLSFFLSSAVFLAIVSLAGNYGHQSAILAGMMTARKYADVVVTIDADLQQDIEALDSFLAC